MPLGIRLLVYLRATSAKRGADSVRTGLIFSVARGIAHLHHPDALVVSLASTGVYASLLPRLRANRLLISRADKGERTDGPGSGDSRRPAHASRISEARLSDSHRLIQMAAHALAFNPLATARPARRGVSCRKQIGAPAARTRSSCASCSWQLVLMGTSTSHGAASSIASGRQLTILVASSPCPVVRSG